MCFEGSLFPSLKDNGGLSIMYIIVINKVHFLQLIGFFFFSCCFPSGFNISVVVHSTINLYIMKIDQWFYSELNAPAHSTMHLVPGVGLLQTLEYSC